MTRRQSYRSQQTEPIQTDPVSMIIAIVVVGIILLWIYIIKPTIDWITQLINSTISWLSSNSTEIIYGIVISVVIVAILYILSEKARKQHEEEQRAREEKLEEEHRIFEEEQRAKGLIKFTDRFIKEKWGAPQEVECVKSQRLSNCFFCFSSPTCRSGVVEYAINYGFKRLYPTFCPSNKPLNCLISEDYNGFVVS